MLQNEPIRVGPSLYSCPYCQKLMNDKCKIVRHIRIHTGEKPYQCSQCNYASNQKEALKGHFNRMHC